MAQAHDVVDFSNVVENIRLSEEYLAKLHKNTAEAQEQTDKQKREMLMLEEKIGKLKEELGPLKKNLATQQATLAREEKLFAEVCDLTIKAEKELKTAKFSRKNEEKELHQLIEDMMIIALDFSNAVRPDNPTVVPHMESLVKQAQDLYMEETSLRCEIKVLEENLKDVESRSAQAKQREKQFHKMENDLLSQIQSEKQLRDELSKSYNETINQKTSELVAYREELECLEAAYNTMKLEVDTVNSNVEKLKEKVQGRPKKRPVACDFWSPVRNEEYKSDRETSSHSSSSRKRLATVPTPSTPKTFTRNPPPSTPVEIKVDASLHKELLHEDVAQSERDDVKESLSHDTSRGADYPSSSVGVSTSSAFVEKTSDIPYKSTQQKTSDYGEQGPSYEFNSQREENKSTVTSHHIKYKCTLVVHEDEI